MDTFEKLGSQLSQITMYDVKSMYNQAKNIVLNVSEMEAKVRDATNDDPWGASSTLMTEIAQGTFNYQLFNEIMPCIYSRFMEKEARQWRQIYKALQLLEYLVKHGSERVVDDARAHLGTIKMLRSFHYIDDKGKDQGINIRNRAREIVELLGDLDKVRTERKKAKSNRSKYTGVGNDELSFSSGGSRYGGFGSDRFESSGSSGGGGWSGGGVSSTSDFYQAGGGGSPRSGGTGFRDSARRQEFDEYDAGDDDTRATSSRTQAPPQRRSTKPEVPVAVPPAPAPVVDLIGDFDNPAPTPASTTNKALPAPVSLDDDDFGDFAGATPAPAPVAAAPKPTGGINVFDMLNGGASAIPVQAAPRMGMGVSSPPMATMSPSAPAMSPSASAGFGGMNMRVGSSPLAPATAPSMGMSMGGFTAMSPAVAKPTAPTSKPTAASSNFDDLWSMSLGSAAAAKPAGGATGKSMKDLEKEKSQTSIWGGGAQKPTQSQWGAFAGSSSSTGAASGGDDLLL